MDFQPTTPPFQTAYAKAANDQATNKANDHQAVTIKGNGHQANDHQVSQEATIHRLKTSQVPPAQLTETASARDATSQVSDDKINLTQTCEKSATSDTIDSCQAVASPSNVHANVNAGNWKFFGASVNQELQAENQADSIVKKLDSGELWVVNSRRRNGLIVLREFHAEFAGPGAAVGGGLDEDIVDVIPIGKLSLLEPDSHEAHQNAIKIRLQWIRLTQNFTDQPEPNDRARMILEQFKTYFDQDTVDTVPDEAFALLVGVLPQTIRRVRSGFVW